MPVLLFTEAESFAVNGRDENGKNLKRARHLMPQQLPLKGSNTETLGTLALQGEEEVTLNDQLKRYAYISSKTWFTVMALEGAGM
ncbi:MAG: hypothetical protein ACP5GH_01655 [Nitrososphaeria archaeon]